MTAAELATCRWVQEHLHTFVDGELDTSLVVEFDRHFSCCPGCRERLEFERAFRAHVKAACTPRPSPGRLRERVLASLDEADARRGALWGIETPAWSRPLGVPAAAASFLVFVGTAALFTMAPVRAASVGSGAPLEAGLLPEAVEDVVRLHRSALPPDVTADTQQVVDYLAPRIAFHARPAELPEARFQGARVAVLRGQSAPAFYYMRHGRRVTVVVLSSPDRSARPRGDGPIHAVRVGGAWVPVIERGGLRYVIFGDLDDDELMRIAAQARVP